MPGRFLIAARMVRLYEALGVRATGSQTGRMMRPHDHGRQLGVPRPHLGEGALVLVRDR